MHIIYAIYLHYEFVLDFFNKNYLDLEQSIWHNM